MKISQREAQRLKKRVKELEDRELHNRRAWAREYIGGVNLDTINISDVEVAICRTARKLGHALVVLPDDTNNRIFLYALKP